MNRNVHSQIADQRGVDIREPSTANLFINSTDRDGGYDAPVNPITISKNESLMNGYFTRLAVQEVCLTWTGHNISAYIYNDFLQFRIAATGATLYTANIANGNYTVAELMDALVEAMNAALVIGGAPAGYTFAVVNYAPNYAIELTNGGIQQNWTIPAVATQSNLNDAFLHLENPVIPQAVRVPMAPDLRPFYYIDFVCNQLTYNQEVKDGTTQTENRDVLYRWYFAYDNWASLDAYGFPVYMGYLPFTQRRCIPFPKQIKWAPNQPVGNLKIEIYDSLGELIDPDYLDITEYQFTLLASEV